MANKPQRGLGKGIGALLGGDFKSSAHSGPARVLESPVISTKEIEIKNIVPNPYQPRKEFAQEYLNELADSIKRVGIIQPITVKRISVGKYQIISGERRYRASLLAGLSTMPAYVREAEDSTLMEMALIENIQREDLNPIEIALGFQSLIEEFKLTQEELSQRIGKKRATISNYVRLLKLNPEIQLMVKENTISMGHAKAIMGLSSDKAQLSLAKQIAELGLSVREAESFVQKANSPLPKKEKKLPVKVSESVSEITNILGKYFKDKVAIKPKEKGAGELVIRYESESQLKEFLGKLKEHNL